MPLTLRRNAYSHVLTIAASLAVTALTLACSGPVEAGSTAEAPLAANATPPAEKSLAIAVLRRGGRFMFSLDESEIGSITRDRCAREADAEACYARIRDRGAQEGLRFAQDGAGHTVFTSFGPEPGDEGIYIEVPLDLTADGPNGVVATIAGPARGTQIKSKGAPQGIPRFEVIDGTTIAMIDPIKGRFVFHRAAE